MTTTIDVSVPLVPGRVPLYPGDAELEVERIQARAEGEQANVSRLALSVHCGTHVDAPVHFLDERAPGVEAVPLDALVGPAWVVDATPLAGDLVDASELDRLDVPDGAERVLFKTRNSALWDDPRFVEDFVAVAPDAAAVLVERGVRLVGIDYLSIAAYEDPVPTHQVLLRAGVAILETLDLRAVEPGAWHLTCLPLLIPGADGAPARAVLTRE